MESGEQSVEVAGARSVCGACHATYRIIVAILVRCLLLVHSLTALWLLVSLKRDNVLWSLAAINVLLLIDTVYTVVKRKGRESKWSVCGAFVCVCVCVCVFSLGARGRGDW